MECEICHKDVFEAGRLHRVNEKGVNGIWRCNKCLTVEQKKMVDPICDEICDIIEEDNRRRK